MKEREQILNLWSTLRAQNKSCVLVTVVKTLGSSYRRPGARLLISDAGQRVGSISGGCLEDDVLKKAWWLTENGPVIRRYDTTPDGEIGPSGVTESGFGLGCNGIIYLLLQRIRPNDETSPLTLLEKVHTTRQSAWLAHTFNPPASLTLDQMTAAQRHTLETLTQSQVVPLAPDEDVFFETLHPPVRLLVFGAGDDAVPLVHFARQLGWQTDVIDGRAHYARRERFPHANNVWVRDSTTPIADLYIDPNTVAVVMTHSYSQDLNFLKNLAVEPLAYLGILGPRNRSERLLADAALPAPATLHAPAGLDIGADGPEQVALSIIAEIQASLNSRNGGSLRTRSGSIHSAETDGLPFVPSIVCA